MDSTEGQVIEGGQEEQQPQEEGDGNYLQAIVDNLTPEERTELSSLLQKSMQQDRQKGTLSVDDFDEKGSLTPGESGQSEHMTELGR